MLSSLSPEAWSVDHAAHLLNRAGFGGTPAQIRAFHSRGLDAAVERLLSARDESIAPPEWTATPTTPRDQAKMFLMNQPVLADVTPEQRTMATRDARRADDRKLSELRAWWLQRMRRSGQPLVEKMTLFWHGHFATSMRKVESAWMMWRQNQTLREHALGDFRSMLRAMARDPAMMHWLDLDQSQAAAPNENFARELMELFTLGIGHYTEDDVKNAARAFTGHRIEHPDLTFTFAKRRHDYGEKVFLGRRGNFDGDGIIDVILTQPACARFVAGRIWEFFACEDPEPATLDAAALRLSRSGYRIADLLGAMFRSEAFYSPAATRTHVKSPVEWLVQTCVALETDLPKPPVANYVLNQLGQSLFAPPNVRGWEGGRAWISTSTLMQRYNYLTQFLGMANPSKNPRRAPRTIVDVAALVPADLRKQPDALADDLTLRLYGATRVPRLRERAMTAVDEYSAPATDAQTCAIFQQLMNTPDYQIS